MEGATCDICFTLFSEEFCVPKVLECGHTMCLKCLENVLQCQKNCPTCRKTLLKSLEEYPTYISLLKSSKRSTEKCYPDHQEINSIKDKENLQMPNKESFANSIEENIFSLKSQLVSSIEQKFSSLKEELLTTINMKVSSPKNELVASTKQKQSSLKNELLTTFEESNPSLKNEITDSVENCEKFLHEELELFDDAERKELKEGIDSHGEVQKNNHCNCYRKGMMLQLSQYKNEKHFLCDLVVRLHNDEKIYACELIGIVGWRYGEITFSENRIHIHCLSSDTIENDVFVVSLRDLRKCIGSKEDLLPFILIGDQKLIFTLTEDLRIETLRLIKLFTGEGGQTLKGIKVFVFKDYPEKKDESGNNCLDSLDFNKCRIPLPTTINETDYEKRPYKMSKEDIIISGNLITFVLETKSIWTFDNVVGVLHKKFQIDFGKMLNKKVEDSGICFSL